MTNEERDRLLAWLDEQIDILNAHIERECLSDDSTDIMMGFIDNGAIMAYNAVKSHLQAESEATNDEA